MHAKRARAFANYIYICIYIYIYIYCSRVAKLDIGTRAHCMGGASGRRLLSWYGLSALCAAAAYWGLRTWSADLAFMLEHVWSSGGGQVMSDCLYHAGGEGGHGTWRCRFMFDNRTAAFANLATSCLATACPLRGFLGLLNQMRNEASKMCCPLCFKFAVVLRTKPVQV